MRTRQTMGWPTIEKGLLMNYWYMRALQVHSFCHPSDKWTTEFQLCTHSFWRQRDIQRQSKLFHRLVPQPRVALFQWEKAIINAIAGQSQRASTYRHNKYQPHHQPHIVNILFWVLVKIIKKIKAQLDKPHLRDPWSFSTMEVCADYCIGSIKHEGHWFLCSYYSPSSLIQK